MKNDNTNSKSDDFWTFSNSPAFIDAHLDKWDKIAKKAKKGKLDIDIPLSQAEQEHARNLLGIEAANSEKMMDSRFDAQEAREKLDDINENYDALVEQERAAIAEETFATIDRQKAELETLKAIHAAELEILTGGKEVTFNNSNPKSSWQKTA